MINSRKFFRMLKLLMKNDRIYLQKINIKGVNSMEKKEFKLWKKILIIVFLIIVLLFLVLTIRKIIIISSLEDKLSEYQQLDNIYSKSYNNSPNGSINFEKYYKDNVEKDILSLSEDNKKVTQYIYDDKRKVFTEYNNQKTVEIEKNSDSIESPILINYTNADNFLNLLYNSLTTTISTGNLNGHECYILSSSINSNFKYKENSKDIRIYVDKATGLTVQYEDVINNQTITYEYSFNEVSDEDMKEPDITQYTEI